METPEKVNKKEIIDYLESLHHDWGKKVEYEVLKNNNDEFINTTYDIALSNIRPKTKEDVYTDRDAYDEEESDKEFKTIGDELYKELDFQEFTDPIRPTIGRKNLIAAQKKSTTCKETK